MEMAGSRRGVRKFLCKIGFSILYDVFRDEFHVPCLHQLGGNHLRLRQGGEYVADLSGNGATFPDVLETKGQEHDGATKVNDYFSFE